MAKLNHKMKQKSKAGGGNKQAMQFNHALGQHILKNPLIIQALVEKVNIQEWSINSQCEVSKFWKFCVILKHFKAKFH